MLAIFDAAGQRIGTGSREQVHREGAWHQLVFVWAARVDANGSKRFLLQLRSRAGDPYRGQVDALAGGHVIADETPIEGAMREFREEAGVEVRTDELLHLGQRFLENPQGLCQRVIEHFYLCIRPIQLSEPVFTSEVNGFVEVDLDEFGDLLEDKRRQIGAWARSAASDEIDRFSEMGMEALSAYSEPILDSFRRSVRAVAIYLETGEVTRQVWE